MGSSTTAPVVRWFLASLLVFSSTAAAQETPGKWRRGRATFYGTDAWSIHKGSCGFGWLDRTVATGYNIAAISDTAPDFAGSCGKCKEVRCRRSSFADGYGQWLDRQDACYDTKASVVVMITDQCPCHYPDNYASNKRWCCGDIYHLDLSVWAYERLANKKWGVIGVAWRDVPCWYKPKKQARLPAGSKPSRRPSWERPPSGWQPSMDRRIGNRFQWQNGESHSGRKH